MKIYSWLFYKVSKYSSLSVTLKNSQQCQKSGVIRCQINPPGPINPEKPPRLSNAMSTEIKSKRRKSLKEENFFGKSGQNYGWL